MDLGAPGPRRFDDELRRMAAYGTEILPPIIRIARSEGPGGMEARSWEPGGMEAWRHAWAASLEAWEPGGMEASLSRGRLTRSTLREVGGFTVVTFRTRRGVKMCNGCISRRRTQRIPKANRIC